MLSFPQLLEVLVADGPQLKNVDSPKVIDSPGGSRQPVSTRIDDIRARPPLTSKQSHFEELAQLQGTLKDRLKPPSQLLQTQSHFLHPSEVSFLRAVLDKASACKCHRLGSCFPMVSDPQQVSLQVRSSPPILFLCFKVILRILGLLH